MPSLRCRPARRPGPEPWRRLGGPCALHYSLGRELRLDEPSRRGDQALKSYVIGRSPYADVILADTSVARRHAEVVVTDDNRFYVTDCASENGTWRQVTSDKGEEDWETIRQAFVASDDVLRFGNHRCSLRGLLGQMTLASGGGGGSVSEPGRWQTDAPRESGSNLPRGRVERDPITGEVVPKRL